jgi:hypothetical protein
LKWNSTPFRRRDTHWGGTTSIPSRNRLFWLY